MRMVYLKLVQLALFLAVTSASALSNSNPDYETHGARIIGGNFVQKAVPYVISLQKFNLNFEPICSGVIISADFFLTAGHCVDRIDAKFLSAVAGVTDLSLSSGSRHQVKDYIVNENYLVEARVNNIALVKVEIPFALNGVSIAAISFTSTDVVGSGVPVYLTGWSSISILSLFYPNNLRVLTSRTISNAECQNTHPSVTASEICTTQVILTGPCAGDAGGPVTNLQETVLIAIMSYGIVPCASGLPDVHTRISAFASWITEKMTSAFPK